MIQFQILQRNGRYDSIMSYLLCIMRLKLTFASVCRLLILVRDREHIYAYVHLCDKTLAEITGVPYFSMRGDKKFDGTIRGTTLTTLT